MTASIILIEEDVYIQTADNGDGTVQAVKVGRPVTVSTVAVAVVPAGDAPPAPTAAAVEAADRAEDAADAAQNFPPPAASA